MDHHFTKAQYFIIDKIQQHIRKHTNIPIYFVMNMTFLMIFQSMNKSENLLSWKNI